MDKQNLQAALNQALEEQIPSASVNLWPRVRAGFAAGPTQQRNRMNTLIKRFGLAALVVGLLCAFLLISPQGRALAQRVALYFTVTEEKAFPIPTDQVYSVPASSTPPPAQTLQIAPAAVQPSQTAAPDASCSTPAAQAGYFCQVKAVENQAGFNAMEFPNDPRGLKFTSASFTPSTGEITLAFEVITGGGYFSLRQGFSDFPQQVSPWGQVPSDAVEQVSVNGQYAELASGTFVVYPDAAQAVWEPGGQLSLAWRAGERWFVLEKMGDPYPIEWITPEQLIQLAESLIEDRPADFVAPLDPEYLASVEQAEALAGFAIPVPAALPAGFELKRAAWTDGVARLMYGPKESPQPELFIFVGQLNGTNQAGPCPDCPAGVTQTAQVGPWQAWYWRGIFRAGAPAAGQPAPTPAWDGSASTWSLTWNTDSLWVSMFYSPAENSGKEASKEMLVEIASSMK